MTATQWPLWSLAVTTKSSRVLSPSPDTKRACAAMEPGRIDQEQLVSVRAGPGQRACAAMEPGRIDQEQAATDDGANWLTRSPQWSLAVSTRSRRSPA